jgi:FixJ family two-component response regulator
MKAGAAEFLTKPLCGRGLLAAVRAALSRDQLERKERLEIRELRQCFEQLTPREREVMLLIVAGLLNKQVASTLDTTERTIKFHRSNIMKKMHVESLAGLVRMAERLGVCGKD